MSSRIREDMKQLKRQIMLSLLWNMPKVTKDILVIALPT
jgi:hypothetical protein